MYYVSRIFQRGGGAVWYQMRSTATLYFISSRYTGKRKGTISVIVLLFNSFSRNNKNGWYECLAEWVQQLRPHYKPPDLSHYLTSSRKSPRKIKISQLSQPKYQQSIGFLFTGDERSETLKPDLIVNGLSISWWDSLAPGLGLKSHN